MGSQFPPKKNTSYILDFTLYKNDGTVVANPGTITKKISIDGGELIDVAASVTQENTTYGQLSLILSSSEMNGDRIWIYITDDTEGTIPFTATLITSTYTLDEVGDYISAIKAKTDNLPDDPASESAVEEAIATAMSNIDIPTEEETAAAVWSYTSRLLSSVPIVLPVMQSQVYTATALQGREVVVVQGDTPTITFALGDDYTGWTPYFGAKAALADTAYVIDPKAGSWVDAALGQGTVALTAVETATVGKYYAEIELRNGDQRLTAMKFTLKIIGAVIKE